MKLTIDKIAYHRNGVAGEPFKAVVFQYDGKKMLGIRFEDGAPDSIGFSNPRCAVFDLELLAQGVIEFGENSWRGDQFADELDKLLEEVTT
jgi:hypothetical protein